jgi:hypothetical protein
MVTTIDAMIEVIFIRDADYGDYPPANGDQAEYPPENGGFREYAPENGY